MTDSHAILSASGAKKWLNCPLSIKMESEFPDTNTVYSTEGTTAHALAEAKLQLALKNITKRIYTKKISLLQDIDENMQEYTDDYRDFIIERYNSIKKKSGDVIIEIEKKVDFSKYAADGFGTCDAVIVTEEYLEIIDLKYGQGVKVSAKDNPQLKLYALGALEEYDFLYDIQVISMIIYQPRLNSISEDFILTKDLIEWAEQVVRPKADMAYNHKGLCIAGLHCDEGFCKARPICKAYSNEKLKILAYEYKDANKLTNEEISDILSRTSGINSWLNYIKEYAYSQAINHNVKYPGYKLVEGRSKRTYSDIKVIEKILKANGYTENDIYNKDIKAITNIEKMLGKKKFNELLKDYILISHGNPTLVPESDTRPALNSISAAQEDFKNIKIN